MELPEFEIYKQYKAWIEELKSELEKMKLDAEDEDIKAINTDIQSVEQSLNNLLERWQRIIEPTEKVISFGYYFPKGSLQEDIPSFPSQHGSIEHWDVFLGKLYELQKKGRNVEKLIDFSEKMIRLKKMREALLLKSEGNREKRDNDFAP